MARPSAPRCAKPGRKPGWRPAASACWEAPDYVTITGFVVTPVVGMVLPPFELHPEPGKWPRCSRRRCRC